MQPVGERTAVLVRGGGEMATGVAATLFRAGFRVLICETDRPRAIRRTVAFASAIPEGEICVEGIRAVRCRLEDLDTDWGRDTIPVLIDPGAECRSDLQPPILVDAILSKRNAGQTGIDWAPLVIGLGPGFRAGVDCHLVVETQRGHYLGRIYDRGHAMADTGVPGELGGASVRRLLRAPASGSLTARATIGQRVRAGDVVATCGDQEVRTELDGVLRGLMADGSSVQAGEKIGDVDPRGRPEYCHYMSDKARYIGLAVLSAVVWDGRGRPGGPLPAPPDTPEP